MGYFWSNIHTYTTHVLSVKIHLLMLAIEGANKEINRLFLVKHTLTHTTQHNSVKLTN